MTSAMTLAVARLVLNCDLGSSCLRFDGSQFVALSVGFLADQNRNGPCAWQLSPAPQQPLPHKEQCEMIESVLETACYSDMGCETVSLLMRPAKFIVGACDFV
jgi:hypothetical protein